MPIYYAMPPFNLIVRLSASIRVQDVDAPSLFYGK